MRPGADARSRIAWLLLVLAGMSACSSPPNGEPHLTTPAGRVVADGADARGSAPSRPLGVVRTRSGGPPGASPASRGGDPSDLPSATTTLNVNTLVDENNGYGVGGNSLREAIAQANSNGGSNTIIFYVIGTIDLTGALPDITADTALQGPGAASLTVRRNTGGSYRIFNVAAGVTASMSGFTIANGSADSTGGGGISNYGTLSVTGCVISGNNSSSQGGGINNLYGTLTLTGTTISGNTTGSNGGGLYTQGGTATLTGCTISGNSDGQYGGGIASRGTALSITSSTLSGNTDGSAGGGLYAIDGSTTLTNVTFSGNSTPGTGGAIAQYTGTLALESCTFASNSGTGEALFVAGGALTVHNTILSGSSAAQCVLYGGSTTSSGYNLASDSSCGLTQTSDKPATNPQLGVLASNGSSTQTHALLYNSPALDAGAPTGAPTTDQRGQARTTDGNGDGVAGVDIGAFEAASNAAPVLDTSGAPVFTAINEDNVSSSGTLVSAMLATGANGAPIADSDVGDPKGIAVIALDAANGSWEYSTNNGSKWTAFGTVSATAARLLASDGATRIRFVPTTNYNGSQTLTFRGWDQRYGTNGGTASITAVGTGGTTSFSAASEVASITVNAVNDAPTVTSIAGQVTNEDTATAALAFTVDDVESAATSLVVTGSSSNKTLVPDANLKFAGTSADRTLTITPVANLSGSSTITLSVSDGAATTTTSFVLTVTPVNDTPTLTFIAAQTTLEDTAKTGIAFTVDDVETAPGNLTVTGASSNQTLVSNSNITFGGSAGERTVSLLPSANQTGSTTITLTVSDGLATATGSFVLTVTAVNDPPTVSKISDPTTNEDTATGAISFTVDDLETAAGSLSVTGSSSNTTLLPNASIKLGGSGADRTVTLTPAANQNGTATVTLSVSDGSATGTSSFVLSVVSINDVPTITKIADQSTNESTAKTGIAFTVSDVETAVANLAVSGTSSNTTLVPTKNIVFGGSGASRTVSITPAPGQNGAATITVYVSDGQDGASTSFVLTVVAVNDPPTITDIADQSAKEDSPVGPLDFTVFDPDTALSSLVITGASSNTTLLPTAGIKFGGSEGSRTLTLTPAANQSGTATVTITVSDGKLSATDTVVLTVSAVNDPPTLTAITDQTTLEDTATSALAFTVADVETSATSLTVSGSSSDTTLVPVAGIKFGGTGASRTVTITPAANQSGTATITVSVSDGAVTTSGTFVLTVTAVNDPPTISNMADLTVKEDTSSGAIAFTVADVETQTSDLSVTASSSNTTLVPNSSLTLGGANGSRTLTILPAYNQNGTSTITVTVSDGTVTASDTFVLTVSAVNDAPTISQIAPQTILEDTSTKAIPFTVGDAETAVASLTVVTASSDTSLLPNAGIKLAGTGASRTVMATPAADKSGEVTVTLTVGDGTTTTSTSFVLSITAVNDPPTISKIADQSTTENTAKGGIAFTLGDLDNALSSLVVTGTAADHTLLPDNNIVFAGTGASRTCTVTPATHQTGSTTVTITVSDGVDSAISSFLLTVTAVNDPPTLSNIADLELQEDAASGDIAFTVGDLETPPGLLTVTASSSNTALVPPSAIVLGGGDADRTISITPPAHQNGRATITVTVSDGVLTTSDSFVLTVGAVNDTPTISLIDDQATQEDIPVQNIAFTIADVETPATGLSISAESSNPALVSSSGLLRGGTDSNRTLTINPAANQHGTAVITVTVSDGELSASSHFLLTVSPVNDPPTLTAIPDQVTKEDTPLKDIPLIIGDVETSPDELELSASSSNPDLLPGEGIVFGGSGSERTLTLLPRPDQSGETTITLTIRDDQTSTSSAFLFTVTAVPEAPLAQPDRYQVLEDTLLAVDAKHGVLANDFSPDGVPPIAVKVSDPEFGVLELKPDGSFSYTPQAEFNGVDSFTYTANNGGIDSEEVEVTLTVDPANDMLVAADDAYAVVAEVALEVPAEAGVLANDREVDGEALTLELVQDVGHGTLTLAEDGSFTYTPEADYKGIDTFVYQLSDAQDEAVTATVTLTVAFGDADADGVADDLDNCPDEPNLEQADLDVDGLGDVCDPDDDGDGVADGIDTCPAISNPDNLDTDADGAGDACDSDDDEDGLEDSVDNCPLAANVDQIDQDEDGFGAACDTDGDVPATPVPTATPEPEATGCACNAASTARPGLGLALIAALALMPLRRKQRR